MDLVLLKITLCHEVNLFANSLYDYKKNIGGWGIVLVYGTHVKELNGIVRDSSQHQACLMAILEGLKALKREGLQLHICSFSTSVISPLENHTRLKRKLDGEDTPGSELWKGILEILQNHTFRAEWVTKDSDNPYNARSIELAKLYKSQI